MYQLAQSPMTLFADTAVGDHTGVAPTAYIPTLCAVDAFAFAVVEAVEALEAVLSAAEVAATADAFAVGEVPVG